MASKAAMASPNDHDEDLIAVKLPSGGSFWVYGREKNYWDERVKRYLSDNLFTNVADLQDLDRIITMELFCWRWTVWMSSQVDYWNDPIDEKDLARQFKDTSSELRSLKSGLGIDKVTRDKVKGEDSTSKYLENLRTRAREFGIMREKQLGVALELFNDLIGRVTLYDNTTEDERKEQKCDWPDLREWLVTEAFPKFEAVDEHFRTHSQKFWIKEQ